MPKLKAVATPARKQLEKRGEPFGVGFEVWRKLKQHRTGLIAQERQALFDQREAVDGIFRKPLPVRDEFRGLPRKDEIIFGLRPPAFHCLQTRRAIEHTIEFGGLELLRVVLKLLLERKSLWEEWTAPGLVVPSRGPDQHARHVSSRLFRARINRQSRPDG